MDNRIFDGVQLQEHCKLASDAFSTMCSIPAQQLLNLTSNVNEAALHYVLND
jgi:hypothetical protein